MNPLLVIGVPITLMIIGMVLNSFGLSFDQPPSSSEQDPAKRLAAERDGYRQFFDRQRSGALKRQKRIGQYSWLVLLAIVGSFMLSTALSVGENPLPLGVALKIAN
jgi:hypothetical protein